MDNHPDETCDNLECQECCPHEDVGYDHGICLDCGLDCTDSLIGRAEAYYEGDR